jgi:hypothetical protein
MFMNFFVLTPSQVTQAEAFNTANAEVQPRAVDNATPGVGINLNPAASSYAPGATVTLAGTSVAPKRIVDDSAYPDNMKTFLLTLPFCSLETETIFAPVVDNP